MLTFLNDTMIADIVERVSHQVDRGDIILCYYKIEQGKDPHDPEAVDLQSEEFRDWLTTYCEEKIYDLAYELKARAKPDGLPAYRVITAPEDWVPTGHAGDYWSWDKDSAAAYCGSFNDDHREWMLEATLKSEDIDWHNTYAVNVTAEDERELTVIRGRIITPTSHYRVSE